jgi:WD40 repeat protein
VVERTGEVRVYDLATGNASASIQSGSDHGLAGVSSGGRYIFTGSGSWPRTITIWHVATGTRVPTPHCVVTDLVALPGDEEAIVLCGEGSAALRLDLRSGRTVAGYEHGGRVGGIAVSPDGRHMATGGDDAYARIWDIASGAEVARIPQPDAVLNLAFSREGRYLSVAIHGEEVRLWAWRPEDTLAEAGRRASRNLTPAEWRRYLPDRPYRLTFPTVKAAPSE